MLGIAGVYVIISTASSASPHLASLNRCFENAIIEAIVIPELELRNVKMQGFLANVVEGVDDPALEDTSEAFNRIGVNCADDVLMPSW